MSTRKALTLSDAYTAYCDHLIAQASPTDAQRILNELNSGLFRIVLPQLGFHRSNLTRKMTQAETRAAVRFLQSLPLTSLLQVRSALERGFEQLDTSRHSRNTYGGRIEGWMKWAQEQDWYPNARRERLRGQCTPRMVDRQNPKPRQSLTARSGKYKRYSLRVAEMPPALAQEFEAFGRFLNAPLYPGRVIQPIQKSSAESYLKDIRLVMGYVVRHGEAAAVPLEELQFTSLIPLVTQDMLEPLSPKQQKQLWNQAKRQLETLICEYFVFLKHFSESESPRTRVNRLCVLIKAAQFVYRSEVEHEQEYAQLPLFVVLDRYLKSNMADTAVWKTARRTTADQAMKWPDPVPGKTALTVLRETVVEPLRLECAPRDQWGQLRKGRPIAKSHRNFVIWDDADYNPAPRQEETREQRIALSCPIERPAEVPADGWYLPLPADDHREKDDQGVVCDNYLYRTYQYNGQVYPEGVYILDIRGYKTDTSHGPRVRILRNRVMPDGEVLYSYLDRYLCGWWLGDLPSTIRYDWWDETLRGQRGRWITHGRLEFQPKTFEALNLRPRDPQWRWGYLYVGSLTGEVLDANAFARMFSSPAKRLIGKQTTPHTLRYIWATWGFQVGLNDRQLEALAFSMGHTLETLRKMYERCSAAEKTRPIEEAIDELLLQELVEQVDGEEVPKVRTLVRIALKLSPAERQQLIDELRKTL